MPRWRATILALLACAAPVVVVRMVRERRYERDCRAHMESHNRLTCLWTAVTMYEDRYGALPPVAGRRVPATALEGHLAPVRDCPLHLTDAWGHPFLWSCDGDEYMIESVGKDGVPDPFHPRGPFRRRGLHEVGHTLEKLRPGLDLKEPSCGLPAAFDFTFGRRLGEPTSHASG